MIRLPVFGKDSLPHASSRVISLGATTLFWFIFIICAIYIGPKKNDNVKYEVVQLMISPEDHYVPNITQEMIDKVGGKAGSEADMAGSEADMEQNAPAQERLPAVEQQVPVETPVSQPVQKQKNPAPANTNNAQKSPASTAKQPVPVPESSTVSQTASTTSAKTYEYANSVDDMLKTQTANTKPKDYSNVDWDAMFGDSSNAQTSQSVATTKVQSQNSVSGAAATTSSPSNPTASSSSGTNSSGATNNTASSSTLNSLSQMANSNAAAGSNSSDSSTANASSSSSQKTATGGPFEFNDGASRSLKSELKITFSSEASKAITENRDLVISFYINEAGNVYNISFKNSAGIAPIVLSEIKTQINKWIFDSAPNTSIATFRLKINLQ